MYIYTKKNKKELKYLYTNVSGPEHGSYPYAEGGETGRCK